jgi:hypothetical protein
MNGFMVMNEREPAVAESSVCGTASGEDME